MNKQLKPQEKETMELNANSSDQEKYLSDEEPVDGDYSDFPYQDELGTKEHLELSDGERLIMPLNTNSSDGEEEMQGPDDEGIKPNNNLLASAAILGGFMGLGIGALVGGVAIVTIGTLGGVISGVISERISQIFCEPKSRLHKGVTGGILGLTGIVMSGGLGLLGGLGALAISGVAAGGAVLGAGLVTGLDKVVIKPKTETQLLANRDEGERIQLDKDGPLEDKIYSIKNPLQNADRLQEIEKKREEQELSRDELELLNNKGRKLTTETERRFLEKMRKKKKWNLEQQLKEKKPDPIVFEGHDDESAENAKRIVRSLKKSAKKIQDYKTRVTGEN